MAAYRRFPKLKQSLPAGIKHAICAKRDVNEFFCEPEKQREVAQICAFCPIVRECATTAMTNGISYGVWGGLTEGDRRKLRRKFGAKTDWEKFFSQQRVIDYPGVHGQTMGICERPTSDARNKANS